LSLVLEPAVLSFFTDQHRNGGDDRGGGASPFCFSSGFLFWRPSLVDTPAILFATLEILCRRPPFRLFFLFLLLDKGRFVFSMSLLHRKNGIQPVHVLCPILLCEDLRRIIWPIVFGRHCPLSPRLLMHPLCRLYPAFFFSFPADGRVVTGVVAVHNFFCAGRTGFSFSHRLGPAAFSVNLDEVAKMSC